MLRINYYENHKVTETEKIYNNSSVYDYINAYRDAANKAGYRIRVIGPSIQAMRWVAYIEVVGQPDGEYVKVEGF